MSLKPQDSCPSWLNVELLQKAISSYHKDETIKIVDFKRNENFSEHFGSEMITCTVTYNSSKSEANVKSLNIVVKAFPSQDDSKAKVLNECPFFDTEIRMYTETLPIINDLFQRNGLKCEFAPELIYAAEQPFPLLMLRDMRDEGLTAPRSAPEHLDDTKLIFQRLAQFHAASFYLSETKQHNFDDYSFTYYQNSTIVDAFYSDGLRAFREVVAGFQGYDEYLPKIDYLIANVNEVGRRCYVKNAPGEGYNVLNHGDFHLRNLLTKFSSASGRLERLQFIDYQLCVHCSPAIDLGYMFKLSKFDDEGSFSEEELTMHYHGEFVRTLKSFGFLGKVPSLLDLNVEILKHSAFVMMLKIVFLPFMFVDWSKMKMDDLVGSRKNREAKYKLKVKLLQDPLCQRLLKKGLKEWTAKGYL